VQAAHKDLLVLLVEKIIATTPSPSMTVPPEEECDHQRGLISMEGPHGEEVEDQADGCEQCQVEVVPDEGGGDRQVKVEREPARRHDSAPPEDVRQGCEADF
jgi:hypothetical protein